METLFSPRYIALFILFTISFVLYAYAISDVLKNPEKYTSLKQQGIIGGALIVTFGINCLIGCALLSPAEEIEDNDILTYSLSAPPRQVTHNAIAIDYLDDEGQNRHLVIETKEVERNNTSDTKLKLIKVEQVKRQDFFLFGRKIDENRIKQKVYYRLENY